MTEPRTVHKDLFQYQKQGALFLARRKTALLADSMGVGKSAQAIAACDALGLEKILVICPGIARWNWENEIRLWSTIGRKVQVVESSKKKLWGSVVITSYSLIGSIPALKKILARHWDVVVCDECFPYDTLVSTNEGDIPIGRIYGTTRALFALCVSSSGVLEYKKIIRTLRHSATKTMIRVNHTFGSFVCTAEHKIYTENGIAEAKNLGGKTLFVLRNDISPKIQQDKILWPRVPNKSNHKGSNQHTTVQTMRKAQPEKGRYSTSILRFNMRECGQNRQDIGTYGYDTMRMVWQRSDIEGVFTETFLQPFMFRQMAYENVSISFRSKSGSGTKKTGNEEEESDYFFRKSAQTNVGISATQISTTRRISTFTEISRRTQRENIYRAKGRQWVFDSASNNDTSNNRVADGICHIDFTCEGQISIVANVLQSGFSKSGTQISYRDRWKQPQNKEMEIPGCTQDGGLIRSRVESIEVLEPRCGRYPPICSGDDRYVFDIEVEDNHNYFANYCLVSNCHLTKSADARRSRALYGQNFDGKTGIVSKSDRTWLLSGTIMPNHPGELWTHCHALFPDVARDPQNPSSIMGRERWEAEYCVKGQGTNHVVASRNREQLAKSLKPYVLRRTQEQVLPQLPPLRFAHIPVHPDSLPPMSTEVKETAAIVQAAIETMENPREAGKGRVMLAQVDQGHMASLRRWTGLAKAPAIAEYIRNDLEAGMDRIVVFAWHRDVISFLVDYLPDSTALVGGLSPKHKQEMLDEFKLGNSIRALVCNMEVASTAINLVNANNVAFAEPPWTPKDIEQSVKRLHRQGQKRPVFARLFSLQGSFDEIVLNVLTRKLRDTTAFNRNITTPM